MAHYKKLFRIRLSHNYYEDGFTSDFSLIPLPHTQKLASQYKLVFRPVSNGIDVLSLMNGNDTPFLDLGNDNKLSFALILKNTDLLNVTSLPGKANSGQVYHMENSPAVGTTITPKEWTLVKPHPTSFTYTLQSQANSVSLKTIDPFGKSHTSDMTKQGDHFVSGFDLDDHQEGKYLLEATEDNQQKVAEAVYSSELLWKSRPFALVDVFTKELSYNQTKTYLIWLNARQTSWIYRVNLSKDYTGSTISIKDERESPEILFKLIGNTSLESGKTLTFKTYQVNNPNKVARIKFFEKPIKDFKLVIEKNGTKTEITGLPNPAINQVKTEMHINI